MHSFPRFEISLIQLFAIFTRNESKMNKVLLQRGLKKMTVFLLCCFTGPVILHQAFKNQEHPFYYPVLIIGLGVLVVAVFYGFTGIKTLVNALLGERKKRNL